MESTLTIKLPTALRQQAHVMAISRGETVSEVVRTALRRYIEPAQEPKRLRSLRDPELVLRNPIPVHLDANPATSSYTAYEEAFGLWYGMGATPEEALDELADVVAEMYRDLEREEAHLAPQLRRDFAKMREVIAHAS